MTSYKKLNQQLKRPDSFQIRMLGYLELLKKYKTQLSIALTALVVVVASVWGWQYMQQRRSMARMQELAHIDFLYQQETEAAVDKQRSLQEKIAQLDEKIAAAEKEGAKKDPSALASLQSEKTALTSQAQEIKPQHDGSRSQYLAFYKSHQKSAEGWRAALQVVNIDIDKEKFQDAASLLKEFLPLAKGYFFYEVQVRRTYIGLLEELGRWQEALDEADTLIAHADDATLPKALLTKGRLLLLSDRKGDAQLIFDKIINEHNTSHEAGKAKAYKLL